MVHIPIDSLIQTAVQRGASTIHVVVGQPPVIRLDGSMHRLVNEPLNSNDTFALMKSITPESCQLELAEKGSTDFGFAFGALAQFCASVFQQRGNISMVLRLIPIDNITPDANRGTK